MHRFVRKNACWNDAHGRLRDVKISGKEQPAFKVVVERRVRIWLAIARSSQAGSQDLNIFSNWSADGRCQGQHLKVWSRTAPTKNLSHTSFPFHWGKRSEKPGKDSTPGQVSLEGVPTFWKILKSCPISESPQNRGCPCCHLPQTHIPQTKMSMLLSYGPPNISSGARYHKVTTSWVSGWRRNWWCMRLKPKSATFKQRFWRSTKMFCGFKSRWIHPRWCKWLTACRRSRSPPFRNPEDIESGMILRMYVRRSASIHSQIKWILSSKMNGSSKKVTILGCFKLFKAQISLSQVPLSTSSCLEKTHFPRTLSYIRNVSLQLPAPRRCWSVKRASKEGKISSKFCRSFTWPLQCSAAKASATLVAEHNTCKGSSPQNLQVLLKAAKHRRSAFQKTLCMHTNNRYIGELIPCVTWGTFQKIRFWNLLGLQFHQGNRRAAANLKREARKTMRHKIIQKPKYRLKDAVQTNPLVNS